MRFSYLIAFAVAAAVAAWILSGDLGSQIFGSDDGVEAEAEAQAQVIADRAPGADADDEAEPFAVRVHTQTATIRPRVINVRGHTEASRMVIVRAETPGTIETILVNKGDRVTQGQIIATLELGDRPSRLAEIEALLAQRQLEYDIARALAAQGQQPVTRVAAAQTAFESAAGNLARLLLDMEKTEIRAPFDGIIEERQIQIGDFISPGSPAATLVDEDPFLVVGQVSESEIDQIELGSTGTAVLLNGTELQGTVRFIATIADSQTRTFRVELQVPNPGRTLRAEATADFIIPVGTVAAHLVSPAVLVLDDAGNLGVKLVNFGVVEQVPVTVLSSGNDGVWLLGLPEIATIITVGQQFVTGGQTVNAVEADMDAAP
ncbi:MAG: efflux RND transporter periplasmic adaptor subunit [Alphaproteobacteria bacterium]|jgi:membrane fusion protein, multidrug efflux system|nr:efflux RND transporter periplasmic adaptor subunit [Alphaproteobacteria bacterium]MBT4710587.1 efflux RND transporter periplasmic adaptor subunit [Alphaproteobacteria bacterium]MBT5860417.1 efflux RND transporter periplasmic adaptor subunit [Alphaproteobacteria bacterium]